MKKHLSDIFFSSLLYFLVVGRKLFSWMDNICFFQKRKSWNVFRKNKISDFLASRDLCIIESLIFTVCKLTPPAPREFQKVVKRQKLTFNFFFALLCGASKCFMKAFHKMVTHTQTKVFIKPFEAPQRSVKIKV